VLIVDALLPLLPPPPLPDGGVPALLTPTAAVDAVAALDVLAGGGGRRRRGRGNGTRPANRSARVQDDTGTIATKSEASRDFILSERKV
jgi:hypothetical protein